MGAYPPPAPGHYNAYPPQSAYAQYPKQDLRIRDPCPGLSITILVLAILASVSDCYFVILFRFSHFLLEVYLCLAGIGGYASKVYVVTGPATFIITILLAVFARSQSRKASIFFAIFCFVFVFIEMISLTIAQHGNVREDRSSFPVSFFFGLFGTLYSFKASYLKQPNRI